MKIIKKITIVSESAFKCYELEYGGVNEIKDASLEYPESIALIYHVLDINKKLITSIENCPVVVEYK